MGAVFIGIVVVTAISVFGLGYTQHAYELAYQITRTTAVRAEAIWLIVIIGAGIIASAMMIWAFSLGLSQIVGLKTYKPLIIPASMIASMICLIVPENTAQLMHYVNYAYPFIAVIVEFGIEIVLFILALTMNKRGEC